MISELRRPLASAPAGEGRSYLDAREADLTEAISLASAKVAGLNTAIRCFEADLAKVRADRAADQASLTVARALTHPRRGTP